MEKRKKPRGTEPVENASIIAKAVGKAKKKAKPRKCCPCGKNAYFCTDCGGDGICGIHGNRKTRKANCKDCKGKNVCTQHGDRKLKRNCKDCDGPHVCTQHGDRKLKKICIDCKGSAYCFNKDHGEKPKLKARCAPCGGSALCACRKDKDSCTDCMSIEQAQKSKKVCNVCFTTTLSGLRRHIGLCAGCDKDVKRRLEYIVWDKIAPFVKEPTIRDNKLIGGAACDSARTRPDVCWVLDDRIVHVEIDEDSHEDREIACELKKLDSGNWGLAGHGFKHLPTWTIRFNCSDYDGRQIGLDKRCEKLVELINHLLKTPDLATWNQLATNVTYMYYHSKSQKHIDAARAATGSLDVREVIV